MRLRSTWITFRPLITFRQNDSTSICLNQAIYLYIVELVSLFKLNTYLERLETILSQQMNEQVQETPSVSLLKNIFEREKLISLIS